ncbi:MAG TPA: hypothetical protein VNO32_29365 [Candidatus Acidoferrum sp.]|nr:hypothetical protein [Candidatus Acidoferrum sp.]
MQRSTGDVGGGPSLMIRDPVVLLTELRKATWQHLRVLTNDAPPNSTSTL